jgi:hypothetical protein
LVVEAVEVGIIFTLDLVAVEEALQTIHQLQLQETELRAKVTEVVCMSCLVAFMQLAVVVALVVLENLEAQEPAERLVMVEQELQQP